MRFRLRHEGVDPTYEFPVFKIRYAWGGAREGSIAVSAAERWNPPTGQDDRRFWIESTLAPENVAA